jgi:aconitate hydratase
MSRFDATVRSLSTRFGEIAYYSLNALSDAGLGDVSRYPVSLKILLESLLRMQAHPAYTEDHVTSFADWQPGQESDTEYPYMPTRVLLQDFTGVPCVVDLAALRSALQRAGQAPAKIEPQIQVDLVIDHSVQVDQAGDAPAYDYNLAKEFERNRERYRFLRWGQGAFTKLSVLPPGLGICHQVNMEYLATCVTAQKDAQGRLVAYPDTLVGTDSHTTMINSMGVLGWGVGGIEAEAAMLGQPIPLLMPKVTGFRLDGELRDGVTPTDLALAVTQILREKGVVGQFVEFFGPGLDQMTLADRAPVANMSPEYGATMGFFPIDDATLKYLRLTGRSDEQVDLVERYCKEQGLFRQREVTPQFDSVVELDLTTIEPSLAGPKRPQDRVYVRELKTSFASALTESPEKRGFGIATADLQRTAEVPGRGTLTHGSVVIAAITSCTNTSNPSLLIGAGLLAQKAVAKGLTVPDYVKTSMAPGSRVVTEYLKAAGLLPSLEQLGFSVIAYGCTTCIGNSGPLADEIEQAIKDEQLVAAAVLSGNRNFEGRIHPLTQANYLCSPPLVVAYALAGTVHIDLDHDPIGHAPDGNPVYLKDIWPTRAEIDALLNAAANPELYQKMYQNLAGTSAEWNQLTGDTDAVFVWDTDSTYIREPSFFQDFVATPAAPADIENAAVLGLFGDFITTDHISPAGAIPKDSPAGRYLIEHGVEAADFNSYGSRRGNHEVMIRGTFANIRIRNQLVERAGGWTVYQPDGTEVSIYDAAMRYRAEQVPSIVISGKMYGAGSSRDWAAKGTYLLGVKAVIAESFERIHRSNLVEMGVLPLEFVDGQNAASLGLTGRERYDISGIAVDLAPGKRLAVKAVAPDGSAKSFEVKCRIDSPIEIDYFQHGGILQYVLREVMKSA